MRVRFGLAVKKRRAELGISQEKQAELAGMHRTYIAGIERGIAQQHVLPRWGRTGGCVLCYKHVAPPGQGRQLAASSQICCPAEVGAVMPMIEGCW
jgi:DNA-binding XRE family transcriptional regulator